jgi:hypothetical protein
MFLIDTAKFDEYLDGLRMEIPQLAEKIGLSKNQVVNLRVKLLMFLIDDLKKKNEVKFEPVPVASGEVRENIGP